MDSIRMIKVSLERGTLRLALRLAQAGYELSRYIYLNCPSEESVRLTEAWHEAVKMIQQARRIRGGKEEV